jgi:hypothetical protein
VIDIVGRWTPGCVIRDRAIKFQYGVDSAIAVVVHAYHMARKRLRKLLPVRVTAQDANDLRRWARKDSDGNVSEVIRNMLEERRRREQGCAPGHVIVTDADRQGSV